MNQTNNAFRCCCINPDCAQLKEFTESFKRMEYDALLAAEIGQALLKEREKKSCPVESEEIDEDETRSTYNYIKESLRELRQLRWEKENSTSVINVLQAEIKTLKESSKEMKKKVESYEQDAQKKKLCEKLLSIKTEIEEELKTQISDLKQEISQLQKSENNIQTKYKRLEANYETLQLTHESLLKEHDSLLDSISKKIILKHPQNMQRENKNIDMDTTIMMEKNAPEPIKNNVYNKQTDKKAPQFRVSRTNCNKDPFDVLRLVTQQTFEKINATDTRVLNRRLRRVFDMTELSDMSNTILNNILNDLTDFRSQFDWVQDYMDHNPNTKHFFPLVNSIQQLLQEISTIKITLNDLQADYVKRIEKLTISQPSSLQDTTVIKSTAITTTKITAANAIATTASARFGESHTTLTAFSSNDNEKKNLLQELFSILTIH